MSIRARTWSALALPPIIWFVFEQGLSVLLRHDCSQWAAGVAWGAASLTACAFTLRLTASFHRHQGTLIHPWLARLVPLFVGVFCLAIAFQILALALVPSCVG